MSQLKDLLVDELQDLLDAETQLTAALPKMAEAANHPKLKEAFEKHLVQTQGQIERLHEIFSLLGAKAQPKPCKAMMGLVEEGQATIEAGRDKDHLVADLALIGAAQRVEHYEIAGYGTLRALSQLLGLLDVTTLLTRTLGEEESADHLLTAIAQPISQQARLEDMGSGVDLETVPSKGGNENNRRKKGTKAA